ncbi:MAG: saccharopine dehydrogenase NADP-binding domain-containing protein [Flavobacteriales bacterium]|nr:saccharopine dehydrogenase NADP-binding domain-containing protein [Flavobacteriales bacterium]
MSEKKVLVLGAGLIGKAIAIDLCRRHAVTSADRSPEALKELAHQHPIATLVLDITDHRALAKAVLPFDLVIGAVPGALGFATLRTVIEAGRDVVDISFFPEDALALDALAREKNVTAVVDCGVAPGLCNIIAGHHHRKSPLTSYECLVGGLPREPEWPFGYKAVFSPADVIEEYTRPVHMREDGKNVVREALSGIEAIDMDGVGRLEAFNTDGLRTLLTTMPEVPRMVERTLRYPGHAELMKVFRATGLFSSELIEVDGTQVSPLSVTSALLFPQWKMKPNDEDLTVMRVTVENEEGTTTHDLLDHFDRESGTSSMARTTGYTCTAVAELVLQGKYTRKGISPPEMVGAEADHYREVMDYLKERKVNLTQRTVEPQPRTA